MTTTEKSARTRRWLCVGVAKRLIVVLVLTWSVVIAGGALDAATGTASSRRSASSPSGTKTVHVKGYTKKDGTKVAAHERKAPKARTTAPTTPASRDTHGRIRRSAAAKHQFETQSGYPHGRPGYVVDHIVALACGGADVPSNMQWQSVADGKAKDTTERKGC